MRNIYISQIAFRGSLKGSQTTMGVQGFIDWKGNPIDKKKHGGIRAALFIQCEKINMYLSLAFSFLINLIIYF